MTRALLHARQHAETCNGLECAAPEPVSAPYLQAAYERMKLCKERGIRARFGEGIEFRNWFCIGWDWIPDIQSGYREFQPDAEAATAAYFRIIETLTEPAPSTFPVATHDGRAATAGADPASTSASFSPSAPLVSPDPGAVAGEVPPIANASPASNPGAR